MYFRERGKLHHVTPHILQRLLLGSEQLFSAFSVPSAQRSERLPFGFYFNSTHRHRLSMMLDGDEAGFLGQCAMRGSCGSRAWFGQPLPCPYDGPPVEVRVALMLYQSY